MKIGVADYGMSVWDGGFFDYIARVEALQAIGYDGLERLRPVSEADALNTAARLRAMGADFATCQATTPEKSIQWTAAMGKTYVWTQVDGKSLDVLCRQVNVQAKVCARYGIQVAMHNHLGSLVETQEQLETFMTNCPGASLLLDTGHLSVAGGDPLYIAEKYYDRLAAVHVKCWVMTNAAAERWFERGYFTTLGYEGAEPDAVHVPNAEVIALLKKRGYDKWLHVEHDTHLQEPLIDLAESRAWLRKQGV